MSSLLLRALGATAVLFLACIPPPTASFTYELPKFQANLHAANFEYVKFGAVAEVSIPARTSKMAREREIGLVNEAMTKLFAQAPNGGVGDAYALVNVVVDISQEHTVVPNLLGPPVTYTEDDYLVVRADIVRFRRAESGTRPPVRAPKPASSARPAAAAPVSAPPPAAAPSAAPAPQEPSAPHEESAPGEWSVPDALKDGSGNLFFDQSSDSREALAALVAQRLGAE